MKSIFDRMVGNGEDSSGCSEVEAVSPLTNGQSHVDASDDSPRTAVAVKEVSQELLKHGYVEEARGMDYFRRAVVHEREIIAALEPLDLTMRIDSHRGVAYLAVAQSADESSNGEDGWTHPLVRRQRLTLEQSLLVAILRQRFMLHEQEAGVGQSPATIAIDDLLSHFLTYFEDSRSDAKNESKLLNLLDQLKAYGIVSEVDSTHELTIRPLIAHLANPESLAALFTTLKEWKPDGVPGGGDS
jgi:hypothetical protein